MKAIAKRVSALENERDQAKGVAVVLIYDGETNEEAIAAHIAAGGADPSGAEITVLLNQFRERPDEPDRMVVTRQDSGKCDIAQRIADGRARVAKLNASNQL